MFTLEAHISVLSIHPFNFVEISCGQPESTDSSTFQALGLEYGDNVTYACKHGYEHIGGDTVFECMADGRWHGDTIQCQGKHTYKLLYYLCVMIYNVYYEVSYNCCLIYFKLVMLYKGYRMVLFIFKNII